MVDLLKEFVDDYQQIVPRGATLTVDIAGTDITTQNLVHELSIKTEVDSGQSHTVVLEYKGRTLKEWVGDSVTGVDVILKGTQLIPESTSYQLKITGGPVRVRDTNVYITSNTEGYSYLEHPTLPAIPTIPDLQNYDINMSLSANFSGATNDGCYYDDGGIDTFFYISNGTIYWRNTDGTQYKTCLNFATTVHGICTDGVYLYGFTDGATTTLYRIHIVDQILDSVTTASTVYGRAGNQAGSMLYHAGFIYTSNYIINNLYEVNLSTLAVIAIPFSTLGTYVTGSCLVTTTEIPSRTLVVLMGQSAWFRIINTDTHVVENISYSLAGSTFSGNLGIEISPGVAWFAYSSNEVFVDFNAGEGSALATACDLNDLNVFSAFSVALVVPHDQVFNDLYYTAYAKGISIIE